jgi:hypothetical protein
MQRFALVASILATVLTALLPALLSGSAPALAITPKQKMATCKFGADDQKLVGAARAAFMKKCMSSKNDPRGTAVGTPASPGAPTAPEEEKGEPKN